MIALRVARISAIAHNTLREAIRSRVLYTLLIFALLLIGSGVLLSTLSYVERERILQDIGLAAIRIFSVLIAIFVGIGLLHREVDRRTVFTILSKPIGRGEFLLGKYLGLVATLLVQISIMGFCFVLVSWLAGAPVGAGHVAAFAMIAVEVSLVVAIATFFSAFTTPMLAAFFCGGLTLIGHVTRDLRLLGTQTGDRSVQWFTEGLYRALPDLEAFDLTLQASHGLPVAASDLIFPLVYAAAYVMLLLLGASWIFERRDFR